MRGAVAGAVAAAAWAATEPAIGRLFRTPFSDVRLLGRTVTRGSGWPLAGLAIHIANGAAFGAAFERLGLCGVRQGLLVAQLESLALWPGMLVVDRVHPYRRDGSWPPLARSGRVFAYEMATHAVFGAVLGTIVSDR